MTEAEWLACADPSQMMGWLGPNAGARRVRLFSCGCCRRIWDMIADERARRCVEVAEEFADGVASDGKRARAGAALGQVAAKVPSRWVHAVAECAQKNLERQALGAGMNAALAGAGPPTASRPDPVAEERAAQARVLRDIVGPFHPVTFAPSWRTGTAVALATTMYDSRDFSAMPILADALQDAGCDGGEILDHCRDPHQVHVRGCWVVDLILGKG